VVEEGGRAGRLHARGVPAKQRLHVAALLIVVALAAGPLEAQSDIDFDANLSPEQFTLFSRLVAQSIYPTPVEPARARGILGFDIGIAATAVPVDPNAAYWQRSTGDDDFTVSDHLVVPRLVVSKGFSLFTVSGTYAKVQGTNIDVVGGSLDIPIVSGGLVKPAIALRGAYSQLRGVEDLELKTYGAELFVSKGFGPVTPYAAIGKMTSDAEGITRDPTVLPVEPFRDESRMTRITVGVKVSLLVPKLVVEATQAEERSYAAKISFGL
jgi:hypothetical protein